MRCKSKYNSCNFMRIGKELVANLRCENPLFVYSITNGFQTGTKLGAFIIS